MFYVCFFLHVFMKVKKLLFVKNLLFIIFIILQIIVFNI